MEALPERRLADAAVWAVKCICKVLQKKFFDWALIGEDTIVLRTLSIRRTEQRIFSKLGKFF
jgi:hypothetical protein